MRVLWMPLDKPWSRPTDTSSLCCADMTHRLEFTCDQHADPFECGDNTVVYNEIFDEFGLIVHDGGASYIVIAFCPWCGVELPRSQRDRWFDETEAMGLTGDTLPPAYLTGEWRRTPRGE